MRNVSTDKPITSGTNMALILSANCCTGGFSACAVSTILMIEANTVLLPAAVTCAFTIPDDTILPPVKNSFLILLTGKLSPVSKASFTAHDPQMILQSAGTCSPVFMRTKSPG